IRKPSGLDANCDFKQNCDAPMIGFGRMRPGAQYRLASRARGCYGSQRYAVKCSGIPLFAHRTHEAAAAKNVGMPVGMKNSLPAFFI
ncbi:hypothetical protein, partial [Roseixanthobacter pseudopolyaromaticivorans]|uniref:hypothetical protein n=1 Tax=Roseixanthobacter pseudopolyaromaticivorans TaxID=3119920 RepID=UPI00372BBB34